MTEMYQANFTSDFSLVENGCVWSNTFDYYYYYYYYPCHLYAGYLQLCIRNKPCL